MQWLESFRKFQIAQAKFVPVTMIPPPDEAVFKTFALSSGVVYRPDFSRGGRVTVNLEADAIELEREGWSRDTKRKMT